MSQNNGNDGKTVITNFAFCYWGMQLHCAIWGQYFNTTVQLHKDIIQWTIFSCNQETSGKNQHNMFVNLMVHVKTSKWLRFSSLKIITRTQHTNFTSCPIRSKVSRPNKWTFLWLSWETYCSKTTTISRLLKKRPPFLP